MGQVMKGGARGWDIPVRAWVWLLLVCGLIGAGLSVLNEAKEATLERRRGGEGVGAAAGEHPVPRDSLPGCDAAPAEPPKTCKQAKCLPACCGTKQDKCCCLDMDRCRCEPPPPDDPSFAEDHDG